MESSSRNVLVKPSSLEIENAVAAIVVVRNRGYLLQHRDDIAGIWYPDHWGCFGGAVEPGETAEAALLRELQEELTWQPEQAEPFIRLDFDLSNLGSRKLFREYYVTTIDEGEVEGLRVREGQGLKVFGAEDLFCDLRVTPYDAFALFLHFRESGSGLDSVG